MRREQLAYNEAGDTRVPAPSMCHQSSAVSWWAACARLAVTPVPAKRCNHASSTRLTSATQQGRGPSCAARTPPHVVSTRRDRLTRRPCGGGCACGRGARAQHQPKQNQQNRNQRAASARHGRGHECRDRNGRPCRRSACDPRPGRHDASRANATTRKRSHATNARDPHASHRNPNASRPGLVPRSGERSHPGPRGPRRPGRRACAWRAAGDPSCPPEYPGR